MDLSQPLPEALPPVTIGSQKVDGTVGNDENYSTGNSTTAPASSLQPASSSKSSHRTSSETPPNRTTGTTGSNKRHSALNLGSATSYYFSNAPMTPIQKLVRSVDQQKDALELAKRMIETDDSATGPFTGSLSLNQSYLSSSSGEDSTESVTGELILNSNVLSDTTELTASNFVALAATQRTIVRDVPQDALATTLPVNNQQNRPPLQTLASVDQRTASNESSTSIASKKISNVRRSSRRQSMAAATVHSVKTKDALAAHFPRRRDTIAALESKPRRNEHSIPDASNDKNFDSVRANDVSTATPTESRDVAVDSTVEGSISDADMQALLHMSVPRQGIGSDSALNGAVDSNMDSDDDSTVIFPFRMDGVDTNSSTRIVDLNALLPVPSHTSQPLDQSKALSPSIMLGGDEQSEHRNPELDESTVSLGGLLDDVILSQQSALSVSNTDVSRSSAPSVVEGSNTPSKMSEPDTVLLTSGTKQSRANKSTRDVNDSPARNTRSKTSPMRNATASMSPFPGVFLSPVRKIPSTQSPKRSTPRSKKVQTKAPSFTSSNKSPKTEHSPSRNNRLQDSPAKNTRSKSPKKTTSMASTDRSLSIMDSLSRKKLSTGSPHRTTLSSQAQEKDSTTVLLGNILDDMFISTVGNTEKLPHDSVESRGEASDFSGLVSHPVAETSTPSSPQMTTLVTHAQEKDGTTVLLGNLLDDILIITGNNTAETSKSARSPLLSHPGAETSSPHMATLSTHAQEKDGTTVLLGNILDGILITTDNTTEKIVHDSAASLGEPSESVPPGVISHPVDDFRQQTPNSTFLSDNMASRSDVSRASSISTPTGLGQVLDESIPNHQLQSPPSTIRFHQQDDAAPFVPSSVALRIGAIPPKSPFHKALTPTRLKPSPRRLIRSDSFKPSPLRQALTPTKLHQSPGRLRFSVASGSASSVQARSSKRKMDNSTDEEGSTKNVSHVAMQEAKRSRSSFEEMQENIERRNSLSSVLRPPSVARSSTQRDGRSSRRVAFASPTTAEFNVLSPSISLTPMPDTRTFGRNDGIVKRDSGTPFQSICTGTVNTESSKKKSRHHEVDSDMSIDSLESNQTEDKTMALEKSMHDLLANVMCDHPASSPIESHVDETTMELEPNINFVLGDFHSNNDTVSSSCHPSIRVDEERTMELEADIGLLFDSFTASSELERSPYSSRRFSIAPVRRLSLSVDGGLKDDTTSVFEPLSFTSTGSSKPLDSPETFCEVSEGSVTVTNGEILSAAVMNLVLAKDVYDFLSDVRGAFSSFNWTTEVLTALIGQIHQTILNETPPNLSPETIVPITDDNRDKCQALQTAIRGGRPGRLADEIHSLATSLHDCDLFEWHTWLVSATEQLEIKLEERGESVVTEMRHLDNLLHDVEAYSASMKSTADQINRYSRLNERKQCIQSLEIEVNDLEERLMQSQSQLESIQRDNDAFANVIESVVSSRSVLSSSVHECDLVESSKRQFTILQGVMKWKPSMVTESQLSASYSGSCLNTCVDFSFRCDPPIFCLSSKPELFQGHHTMRAKKLSLVSPFLKAQVDALSLDLKMSSSHGLHDLGNVFQRLDWQLGRLECTATEIATVKRRYKAKLLPGQNPSCNCFQLEIVFSNQSAAAKIGAVFSICNLYPFAPIEVCFSAYEESFDVDALHRLLIKSAKPGFGYLSRICDIVSSRVV